MAAVEARQWNVALDLLKRGVDASIVGTDGATIATMIERAQSTHRDNPEFQQVLTAIRKS